MYYAIIGYAMVFLLIYLLMKGKSTPMVLFIALPLLAGICAGFDVATLNELIKKGVGQTTANAVLFCFSILYFNMMNELGIFDPLVNFLVKKAGNNIVAICVAASLVGIVSHLDGSSSTTLLVTIPAMLPIFQKLRIRPVTLLAICGSALGVMNLTPWAGPLNRIAVVTTLDLNYLWGLLIPLQVVGVIASVGLAVYLGFQEKRLGAGGVLTGEGDMEAKDLNDPIVIRNKKMLPFNLCLTIALIAVLSWGKITVYIPFMVAFAIAALVNFPSLKVQDKMINKYAPAAFFITATMLASGVFVGILNGGKPESMLTEMANLLLQLIPAPIAQHLHILMGFLGVPIGLVLGGDAYLYGLLPLCIKVGQNYGISQEAMSISMVIGKNVGMIISPVFASTYLAIGLAGVELKDHMKFSFFYLWIISVIMVISGALMGIYPF